MSSNDVSLGGPSPVNIPRKSQDPSFGKAPLPIETIPDQFEKGPVENAAKQADKTKKTTWLAALGGTGVAAAAITLFVTRGRAKTAEKAVEKTVEDIKGDTPKGHTESPQQEEIVKAPKPAPYAESYHSTDSSILSKPESDISFDRETSSHVSPEMHEEIPEKGPKTQETFNDAASIRSTGSSTRVTTAKTDLEAAERDAKKASESLQNQKVEAARLEKQKVDADAKAARLLQDHEHASAKVVGLKQELATAHAEQAHERVIAIKEELELAEKEAKILKQEAGLGDSIETPIIHATPHGGTPVTPEKTQSISEADINALLDKKLEALAQRSAPAVQTAEKTENGVVKGASSTDTVAEAAIEAKPETPQKPGWFGNWSWSKPSSATGEAPIVKKEGTISPDSTHSTAAPTTTSSSASTASTASAPVVAKPQEKSGEGSLLGTEEKKSQANSAAQAEKEESDTEKLWSSSTEAKQVAKENGLLDKIPNPTALRSEMIDNGVPAKEMHPMNGNLLQQACWGKDGNLYYHFTENNSYFKVNEDGYKVPLSAKQIQKKGFKPYAGSKLGTVNSSEQAYRTLTGMNGGTMPHIVSVYKAPASKVKKFSNFIKDPNKSDMTILFQTKEGGRQQLIVKNSSFKELQGTPAPVAPAANGAAPAANGAAPAANGAAPAANGAAPAANGAAPAANGAAPAANGAAPAAPVKHENAILPDTLDRSHIRRDKLVGRSGETWTNPEQNVSEYYGITGIDHFKSNRGLLEQYHPETEHARLTGLMSKEGLTLAEIEARVQNYQAIYDSVLAKAKAKHPDVNLVDQHGLPVGNWT
jgi:hypothetical protein